MKLLERLKMFFLTLVNFIPKIQSTCMSKCLMKEFLDGITSRIYE